jgi:hypothetical protein
LAEVRGSSAYRDQGGGSSAKLSKDVSKVLTSHDSKKSRKRLAAKASDKRRKREESLEADQSD